LDKRLRTQEGAGEIGFDDAVPFRELERLRRFSDIDAGIVDEDVDAAEFAATRSAMAATAALSVTSATTDMALAPACRSSATAAADFAALRPTTATAAPAFASPVPCRARCRHCRGDDRYLAAEIE